MYSGEAIRAVYSSSNILVFVNEQTAVVTLSQPPVVLSGSNGFVVDSIETVHQPTTNTAKVFACGLFLSMEVSLSTSETGPESGMGLSVQVNNQTPASNFHRSGSRHRPHLGLSGGGPGQGSGAGGVYSIGQYTARSAAKSGTNSVRLLTEDDPQQAQILAVESDNATDSINFSSSGEDFTSTGRRQDANGNTNYALVRLYQSTS